MKKITVRTFLLLTILCAVSLFFSKKQDTKLAEANFFNLNTEQLTTTIAAQLGFVPKSEYNALLAKYESLEAKFASSCDFFPPNAELGKCYTRCDGGTQLATVTNEVLIKKGYTYKGKEVPYKRITEKILTKPALSRWIARHDITQDCISANISDCQTWQLKEISAVYDTIAIQVIDTSKLTYPIEEIVRNKDYDESQLMTTYRTTHVGTTSDWVEIDCCKTD